VQTDRTVLNNEPDTIIHENEQGPHLLLDVAISGDRNVIKKELGKVLQYKHLTREIQSMCNIKEVIQLIIGVNGTISKIFRLLLFLLLSLLVVVVLIVVAEIV